MLTAHLEAIHRPVGGSARHPARHTGGSPGDAAASVRQRRAAARARPLRVGETFGWSRCQPSAISARGAIAPVGCSTTSRELAALAFERAPALRDELRRRHAHQQALRAGRCIRSGARQWGAQQHSYESWWHRRYVPAAARHSDNAARTCATADRRPHRVASSPGPERARFQLEGFPNHAALPRCALQGRAYPGATFTHGLPRLAAGFTHERGRGSTDSNAVGITNSGIAQAL